MTKAEREALKAEFVTGDYRTLKEFCEAKGIAYNGSFRTIAGKEHWVQDKIGHCRQIKDNSVAKSEQKRVEENVRDVTARQDETLTIANSIKSVAMRLLKNPKLTAKEANALASALYRVNEIERGILIGRENVSSDGIQPIIQILDCAKDGVDDE